MSILDKHVAFVKQQIAFQEKGRELLRQIRSDKNCTFGLIIELQAWIRAQG